MRRFGAGGEPILPALRKVARSYVQDFLNAKDHVYDLLGSRQNAESGRFREELFRTFLRRILPSSLAVDTGFIYGFEHIPTSAQMDVIIWHKAAHSAVYDAGSAVIVPPEAVVAVVSIKSKMTLPELANGLQNLMSVGPLDYAFRSNWLMPGSNTPLPAIAKFLVFYSQPDSTKSILPRIGSVVSDAITASAEVSKRVAKAMRKCDPFEGQDPNWEEARRAFPRLIATIEPGESNYIQGWGPSYTPIQEDNPATPRIFGPGLRRLPWMYRCESKITTSLEKLMFLLLRSVSATLGVAAVSTLASWGDLEPTTGMRIGDAEELVEDEGVALVDADSLPASQGDDG